MRVRRRGGQYQATANATNRSSTTQIHGEQTRFKHKQTKKRIHKTNKCTRTREEVGYAGGLGMRTNVRHIYMTLDCFGCCPPTGCILSKAVAPSVSRRRGNVPPIRLLLLLLPPDETATVVAAVVAGVDWSGASGQPSACSTSTSDWVLSTE